ncbi:hypothetical protein AQI95_31310 [Streptomyces yokosukanensis]|uniref:Uncharacterized protein n=1 Tax=Streptomyces yokosukanensis TaxID=67386 RepID=A0A101NY03_9ACTN|nr:hypothetical protein AQI95_31310 [Streptomyces yokosukanensis]
MDEIAAPLGLDFFIGLPAAERARVSRMLYRQPDLDLTTAPAESVPEDLRELVTSWRDPFSFSNRAYAVTDPPEIDFDSPDHGIAFGYVMNHVIGGLPMYEHRYWSTRCESL